MVVCLWLIRFDSFIYIIKMAFTEEDKALISAMIDITNNLSVRIGILEKAVDIKNVVYVKENLTKVNELSYKLLVVDAV